jgi:NAD(P)-dependent dehydrogenase (short-subunit alcohol dehydrogenase family)
MLDQNHRFANKVAFVSEPRQVSGAPPRWRSRVKAPAWSSPTSTSRPTTRLRKLIVTAGGQVLATRCDVTHAPDLHAAMDATVEAFGGLDVAFNNAGVEQPTAAAADITEGDWDRVIAINLRGVFLAMKHQIPLLLQRGGGAIVNTSSRAGVKGFAGGAAYGASKFGIIGATKCAALDYAGAASASTPSAPASSTPT